MAEYRSTESEVELAKLALRHLAEFAAIEYQVADDDPLRRAFEICRRALLHGLWSSPVLKVEPASTALARLLPHGERCLETVDEQAEQNEKNLQSMYEAALGDAKGTNSTGSRRVLLADLVRTEQHLLAVLRGETRAGVLFTGDASTEALRGELDALCASTDLTASDLRSLPRFLVSFSVELSRGFGLRYGRQLDLPLTMNALAGLVQHDERLRRADQSSLPGRAPRGGIDHRDAILELLVAAGCLDPLDLRDTKARQKAVDTIGRDLLRVKKEIGKITFPNARPDPADQADGDEDPKASGCTDSRGSGPPP